VYIYPIITLFYTIFPILPTTQISHHPNEHPSRPAAMKIAAFSVLFALVASVVAVPADTASNLVRKDE
jgi:hypothetical protein